MDGQGSVYRFAGCELDAGRRELRRAGTVVPMQPKVFDLLLYLVEHRERVVGKDELQDAIWTGTIVTETALTRAIMKARRAAGDDSERQAIIQTVQRHGYRLIAPVAGSAAAADLVEPEPVQFVRSDGVHIGWRSLGAGAANLVFVPGFVSHLEIICESSDVQRMFAALAKHYRIVIFDKRGVGLSERVGYAPTLDQTAADIRAVMDAAGVARATLFGVSEGGPAALWFAHACPGRVERLLIWGSMAKGTRSDDYPWALRREQYDAWLDGVVAEWGGPAGIEVFAPSVAANPAQRAWWAKLVRSATTPSGMRAVFESLRDVDVRAILPAIRVPTQIMHRVDDRAIRIGAGRYLAGHIPGASLLELPGIDHWCWIGELPDLAPAVRAAS
jgi:pimeloyl-ACP methyl ester carboxylesterase/DNA-binding winged helix-turn-helix (wHTH) protein